MIHRMLIMALIAVLSWLAWNAWLPDTPPEHPVELEIYVQPPEVDDDDGTRWHVVTHRMVWPQAIKDLQRRFAREDLHPKVLQRREDVSLFVFDDKRRFETHGQASAACITWQQHHIECDIQKLEKKHWLVAIGRFYIPEYAKQHEEKLQRSGLPYVVQQRTIRISTSRFIFPAQLRKQAEIRWQQLRSLGVRQPVMISEQEYQQLYGQAE